MKKGTPKKRTRIQLYCRPKQIELSQMPHFQRKAQRILKALREQYNPLSNFGQAIAVKNGKKIELYPLEIEFVNGKKVPIVFFPYVFSPSKELICGISLDGKIVFNEK